MYRVHADPKKIDKLQSYYEEGIYLGMHPRGNVHIVYDPKLRTAVTSSSLKTLPEENRWDKEIIENVLATPWDWRAGISDKEHMPHVKVRVDPMSTETKT